MKKTVLTFGLISGLIVSVMMMVTMPFHDRIGYDTSMVIGYSSMLAAFLLIYFGVRSYRDNVAGGTVTFGRAFVVGALIALVASVMYTATWEVIFYNFQSDYLEKWQAHQLDNARKDGATQVAIDSMIVEMRADAELYKNPFVNVAFTMIEILPLGLLVALATAGILSRKPRSSPAGAGLATN